MLGNPENRYFVRIGDNSGIEFLPTLSTSSDMPNTFYSVPNMIYLYIGSCVTGFGSTSESFPGYFTYMYGALQNCTGLKKVEYSGAINYSSGGTFANCTSLEDFTIPPGVSEIPSGMFNGCTALRTLNVSDGVTTFRNGCCSGTLALSTISLPSSITTIESYAFYNSGLTQITIDKPSGSISGAPWGATNATVTWNVILYGYRVDRNDNNPETRVSYMYDAVGMTPARMNYTTGVFDYGSWSNAWFITGNKPVALKYDGTVDYELDPNDYTKKADGSASDVSDSTYGGNFMASIPTVYVKRWSDSSYDYYAFSNKQVAPDFYADAHDAGDGTINPFTYLPMFKGSIIDGKMRSIAGVTPQGGASGSEEKTAAEACGSGWQTWDFSKHELVSDLLTLISRSTDSQAAFGQGDTDTYNASDATTYGKLTTGTSGAGQFWGASDQTHHVKVFHIEDFWGNRWERCLGLNLVNNQYVYKLVRPYALDTDSSYTSSGLTAPSEGWQALQNVGRFGSLPGTVGGSNSTYECDYFYKNASDVRLCMFGGSCLYGAYCGSRYLHLSAASSVNQNWSIGGSPCFNAPHVSE